MKKILLLGIVGIAAGTFSAYGQGQILLDNYTTSGPLITYGAGSGGTVGAGVFGGEWTVGLYYAVGTVSVPADPTGTAIPGALALGTGNGSTVQFAAPGIFASIPAFTASPSANNATVTVEIIAYNGADYASSTVRGHSDAFQMAANVPPVTGVLSVGQFMNGFNVYSVAPVPEPTTLALAGIGGLGMLIALRRKKA